MKTNITKTQSNFSIDIELMKQFNIIVKEKTINKSALVEKMILEWVNNNK